MSSPAPEAAPMADSIEEQQASVKRKRNLPGTPDPEAEVIALSPKTLMATNRFLCEVCGKGFQRDQNLQLHRRGHNLPWKLKQRDGQEIKRRVYVCPEASCIHHDPLRALGDLTGIKKHFSRKHGEKKWKCEKCSKRYAVYSDWKAHQKVCGTREYRCDCGTLFSRRDSFISHRAFCDALAQENAKALVRRQVDAQQSSETAGNITTATGELSSAIEASASSFQQQATSEKPESDIVEPLGRDMLEVNSVVNDRRFSRGLQSGPALLPSMTSLCPGLSLSLGTGLGPASHPLEMMGSLPSPHQMKTLACMNPEKNNRPHWPPPLASGGIYTSLLTAANSESESHGCGKGLHSRDTMAGLSMGINENLMLPQFTNSSFLISSPYAAKQQWQNKGNAQLPATTLLQRAAIMGVTKSNSFLSRNFGNMSSSASLARQHDSWAGITTSMSTSLWSSSSLQPTAEGLHLSYGSGYMAGSSLTSSGDHASEQDSRDSSGAPCAKDCSNPASSSSMTGLFLLHGNRDHLRVDTVQEDLRLHSQGPVTNPDLEMSQRVETNHNNRMTLDFLGIGNDRSSQNDVCDKNLLLSADMRPESFLPFKATMDTESEGSDS